MKRERRRWQEGKLGVGGLEEGSRLVGVTYHVVYHIQTVGKAADVSEAGEAKE